MLLFEGERSYRHLKTLSANIDGVEQSLVFEPDDPERIVLTDIVEKFVRRTIANLSGILIFIWLIIMTIMISLNLSQ
jgi:hypothetical protein